MESLTHLIDREHGQGMVFVKAGNESRQVDLKGTKYPL